MPEPAPHRNMPAAVAEAPADFPAPESFFLRRCNRSFIHLRMFRLVTQMTGLGQSAEQRIAYQRRQADGTGNWSLDDGLFVDRVF